MNVSEIEMPHANSGTFHTYFSMQKLLFSGLLGSPTPEATPKFYPLHPKLRMKSLTISPLWGLSPKHKVLLLLLHYLDAPPPPLAVLRSCTIASRSRLRVAPSRIPSVLSRSSLETKEEESVGVRGAEFTRSALAVANV